MKNKKKRSPLPKSLRGKKRYLVVQFFSRALVERKALLQVVRESFLSLFGSVGVAQQKLVFRGFNPQKACLVVQYSLPYEAMVCSGLLFVQGVGGQKLVPQIVFKTGVLHKALKKAGLPA